MTSKIIKLLPSLRFPEFKKEWNVKSVNQIMDRKAHPVTVERNKLYQEVGIKSHGKGLFHKNKVQGVELGNKRVFWLDKNLFIVNIVFAWEQAIARTTENEINLIASHRFPTFRMKNNQANLDFIVYFFKRKKGKKILELASPGGAGRNKTLGQDKFEKSKLIIPCIKEQEKIADFLQSIDSKIENLTKKIDLLNKYKMGILKSFFDGTIGGKQFTYKECKLSELLQERSEKNTLNKYSEVFSVAKKKGIVNQVEHLGRSYASNDVSNYKVVHPFDIVYTKSPTADFPFGIVKQNLLDRIGIVSVLYGVYTPKTPNIGFLIHLYFLSNVKAYNYLVPLVHKGAKNTMNINNKSFLSGTTIKIPTNENLISKIVEFIKILDVKISTTSKQKVQIEQFRESSLQKMFV